MLASRAQDPGAYARKTKLPEELSLVTDERPRLRIKDIVRSQKLIRSTTSRRETPLADCFSSHSLKLITEAFKPEKEYHDRRDAREETLRFEISVPIRDSSQDQVSDADRVHLGTLPFPHLQRIRE